MFRDPLTKEIVIFLVGNLIFKSIWLKSQIEKKIHKMKHCNKMGWKMVNLFPLQVKFVTLIHIQELNGSLYCVMGGRLPLKYPPPFLPSVEILFFCSTIWTNLAYYLLSSCANFAYTRAKDNYANKETLKLSTLNYLFIFLISIYRDNRILVYRENQKTLEWMLLCFTFYFRKKVKDLSQQILHFNFNL